MNAKRTIYTKGPAISAIVLFIVLLFLSLANSATPGQKIISITEAIDTYRDMLAGQLNMYNSAVSNRMNDIMKILTIFASIFIPLTFIAGIYGTNFDYLPELHFKYSYLILWIVMIAVAATMVLYFKRKNWL